MIVIDKKLIKILKKFIVESAAYGALTLSVIVIVFLLLCLAGNLVYTETHLDEYYTTDEGDYERKDGTSRYSRAIVIEGLMILSQLIVKLLIIIIILLMIAITIGVFIQLIIHIFKYLKSYRVDVYRETKDWNE